jgi:RHS repeat-associated protein
METYAYNLANQMTSKTVGGVTTTYTYDLAGQLASESRPGYSCSYSYDANGNRLTKTLNGVTETYTCDDGDKMLTAGSKSYGYDAAGRTTSVTNGSSVTNLSYDWESRLTSLSGAQTASYAYNGFDTRVSKIEYSISTNYVRDGVGVNAPVIRDSFASYTPGTSEKRGSVSTFRHSGLKNAETQTDSSSAISATRSYDAFGNQLTSTGTWAGAFGYAGDFGYQEDASGLKLLGHRYYDSSTGRFLTRDPAKDGKNWYCYCSSNPVSKIDDTGLAAWAQLLGIESRVSNGSDDLVIAIGDYQDKTGPHIIGVAVPPGKKSPPWLDMDSLYYKGKYYEPHNFPISPHQHYVVPAEGLPYADSFGDWMEPGSPNPRGKYWEIWAIPVVFAEFYDDATGTGGGGASNLGPPYTDPNPLPGMPRRLGSNPIWD